MGRSSKKNRSTTSKKSHTKKSQVPKKSQAPKDTQALKIQNTPTEPDVLVEATVVTEPSVQAEPSIAIEPSTLAEPSVQTEPSIVIESITPKSVVQEPHPTQSSLLEVTNLNVEFPSIHGTVQAVRNLSFKMGHEKIAIVGESGSGKSQTGRAILGLSSGNVSAEKLVFDGVDLQALSASDYRDIRGKRISMVMQDPKYSLNPVMTVGKQMIEACQIQMKISKPQALERCMAMLEAVRIRNPQRVFNAYPHEVSGGMGQRIMIAMMLLSSPDLLIADEPTSALDVTVQLQVLAIIDDLVKERGMGLILISHDLPLVASFCDRILVMYAGQVVEDIAADQLDQAQHPYTQGLLACLPNKAIKGQPLATLQRQDSWLDAQEESA